MQRELLRSGALDTETLARHLGIGADEAAERIEWLADRGFVGADASGRWQITMRSHSPRMSERLEGFLDGLIDSEATAGEPHPARP